MLPLDDRTLERMNAALVGRPDLMAGRTSLTVYEGMIGMTENVFINTKNRSHTITAEVDDPEGRRERRDPVPGRPLRRLEPVRQGWQADVHLQLPRPGAHSRSPRTQALPAGHTIEFDFQYGGKGVGTPAYNSFSGLGRPGTGTLKVDGNVIATKKMEKTLPMILQWDEAFDVGSDTLTGVNDADYMPPFALTAKLNKLTIKVDRPQLSPDDIQKLEAAMKNSSTSE